MTDYTIPIIPGINDNPIPPTEINNANADYFISKFNSFVNFVTEENANNLTTPITSSVVYYINSTTGDDINNNGNTQSSPLKTITGLISRINSENKYFTSGSNLFIKLSGIFDSLELKNLIFTPNTKIIFDKFDTGTTPIIQGLNLLPGQYEFYNTNFIISSQEFIHSSSVLFKSTCQFTFTSNTAKIYSSASSIKFESGVSITNNYVNTPFEFTPGSNILQLGAVVITSSTNQGYIFNCGIGCKLIPDYTPATVSTTKTYLIFAASGSEIYISDTGVLLDHKIYAESESLTVRVTDQIEETKDIAARLNALTGTDRIALTAVAGSELITPPTATDIRNSLISLLGDDRLPVSAVKGVDQVLYNYATTTTEFIQPVIGGTVDVTLTSSSFLQPGQYVLIENAGYYEVVSISPGDIINIRNTGDIANSAPEVVIPLGKKITITGRPGFRGFTLTASQFQIPNIGESVNIMLDDDNSFLVGSIIDIDGIDSFEITTINRSSHTITGKRLGNNVNVIPNDIVPIGKRVIVKGDKGDVGTGAFCYIIADFVMPDIWSTVVVTVNHLDFIAVGLRVFVDEVGYFTVTDTLNSTVTLRNDGDFPNLPPATNIITPLKMVPAAMQASPAYGFLVEEVYVGPVNDATGFFVQYTDWCYEGLFIRVGDYVFEVSMVDNLAGTIIARNVDCPDGTYLPANTRVLPVGAKGPEGNTHAVCLADFIFDPDLDTTIQVNVNKSTMFAKGVLVNIGELSSVWEVVNTPDENTLEIKWVDGLLSGSGGDLIKILGLPRGDTLTLVNSFTQPIFGDDVEVGVTQTPWYFKPTDVIAIGNLGLWQIVGKNLTVLTIKCLTGPPSGTVIGPENIIKYVPFPSIQSFHNIVEFTQPAIGDSVDVQFVQTSPHMVIGQYLYSPLNGYYFVESILDSTTAVITNLGWGLPGEKSPGLTVPIGSEFKIIPPRGQQSFRNSYALTTAVFIQPELEQSVIVTVDDNSFLVAGQYVAIENGGPNYRIDSVSGTNSITVTNLGDNITPGTSIPQGSVVTASGWYETKRRKLHNSLATNYAIRLWQP
jgi:hypothetical protein